MKLTKKSFAIVGSTVASMAVMAVPCFAVGTADAAVVSGVTGIVDDVIATITAIAPICLAIFGVFVAWKYGKKIFNKVS